MSGRRQRASASASPADDLDATVPPARPRAASPSSGPSLSALPLGVEPPDASSAMGGDGGDGGDAVGLDAFASLFPFGGGGAIDCAMTDTGPDALAMGSDDDGGLPSLLFAGDEDFGAGLPVGESSPAVAAAAAGAPHAATTTEQKKAVREKALAVKRRRAHRERVKHQLHELRRQMGELSAHLRELQATHGDRENDRATRLRIWKSLAARQHEARAAAVAQNRKLRAQVLHRQSQLRGLFSVLEKRPGTAGLDWGGAGGSSSSSSSNSERAPRGSSQQAPSWTLGGLEPADASLFDAFLGELDAAYAQTDATLRASGVSRLPATARSQHVTRRWDAAREGVVFELVDARVLPFNFLQTRSVLWQSIVRVHCRNPQEIYSRVANPEDTIAVKVAVDCPVGAAGAATSANVAPLVVYLALRRYTESERTVLVWRALSEGRGDLAGLYSDETGWTVLRPATGSSVAGDGATIMETCTRFEPICSGAGESGSSAAIVSGVGGGGGGVDTDLFASLLVSGVDQDNQDITHLMADLILRDLLAADSAVDAGAP